MTVDIKPETERVVREELRDGRFQAWRERNLPPEGSGAGNAAPASRADAHDRAREFVEWAHSHRVIPPLPGCSHQRAGLNPDRW